MSDPVNESGLFASLRRLLATSLEMAQVRLNLLSTEIELEKRRLFNGLLWGAIALLVTGIGLVLLCGFVILLFWEGYRLAAIGVMAILFLATGATLIRLARRQLQQQAGIFNASVTELERDCAELKATKQHEQR
jgi:uncharacterized membrane protein YqjE